MFYNTTNYTPYTPTFAPSTTYYYYKRSNGSTTYVPTPNILGLLFPPKTNSSTGLTTTSDYYYSPTGSDSVITTDTITFNNPYSYYPTTTRTVYYNTPVAGLPYSNTPPIGLLYPDINNDRQTIDSIVDYFHKLTTKKWLLGELAQVLNYFYIKSDGKVDLISNMSDYDKNSHKNLSAEDKAKIIDYIKTFFLTKSTLERILARYCKSSNIKWYNLPKNKFTIRPLIGEKLAKLIKKAIEIGRE